MGKGRQTVTQITEYPDFIKDQMKETFELAQNINPDIYEGQRIADFSPTTLEAQNLMVDYGRGRPVYDAGFSDLTGVRNLVGVPTNTTALQAALGSTINTDELNRLVGESTDLSGLRNVANKTTDQSNLNALLNSENVARGLLTQMATAPSTNPYLENQLANAVQDAVNQTTSQYALGGRLGSGEFAGALGSGITEAALPLLSENLQRQQAQQLAAAQALGSVAGQDLARNVDVARYGIGATQTDTARELAAQQAIADASQQDFIAQSALAQNLADARAQDLSRQGALATSLAGFSQADLARDLDAASTIAQITGQDAQRNLQTQLAQEAANYQRMGLLGDVGAQQTGQAQALLNAQRDLLAEQNLGEQTVFNNMLAASGLAPNFASTTQTKTGGLGNLNNALGGASAGFALASGLGGAGGVLPWLQPYMGALGGGLLGLISDMRLKTNIRKIDYDINGLGIYVWDWNKKGTDVGANFYPTSGYLAQEVKQKFPNAIMVCDDGYLRIDITSIPKIKV
tara:strand:+ start:2308 stop:3858 length:1551 start_codon:yes stop_codon:yes gene_type:complete